MVINVLRSIFYFIYLFFYYDDYVAAVIIERFLHQ
jgi:hypothetical protein